MSNKILSILLAKLILFWIPPKWIPIILKLSLLIIDDPEDPCSVEAVWYIRGLSICTIWPKEYDKSCC
jgi:hypothetical protein